MSGRRGRHGAVAEDQQDIGEHVRPPALPRQAVILGGRSLRATLATPESLMDVTAQPVLFLLLFVYMFGGAIAGGRQAYASFLVPGLLVQTLLLASVAVGVNLNADVRSGVFDRFRTMPIARSAPLFGLMIAELFRYLVGSLVTLGVGALLGWRPHAGAISVVGGCVLAIGFVACVSWLPIWIGLLARTPGAVQGVLLPVMFPLTFASSIFVPVNSVPGWLQAFIRVNPITKATSAVRALFAGGEVARPLGWTLAWMVVLLAVFVPASVAAYRRHE